MSTEAWLPVVDVPGYDVSDHGRIRSHMRPGEPIIKAQWRNPYAGYVWVELVVPGIGKKQLAVHRLVAAAFLGPRPEGLVTRHLDGDDTNNHVCNLRYGTPTQNNLDVLRHGRHQMANRTHCKNGHPFEGENVRPRSDGHGRECVTCRRDTWREFARNKRAALKAAS